MASPTFTKVILGNGNGAGSGRVAPIPTPPRLAKPIPKVSNLGVRRTTQVEEYYMQWGQE